MPSIKSLPEFDASQYLDSDAEVAAYLTDILEANDPASVAASGLTHEPLHEALRPDAQPRFDAVSPVCAAFRAV